MGGVRRWVTTPIELDKWGGLPSVRIVPDGDLAAITVGLLLPVPAVVPDVVGDTAAVAVAKLRAAGLVESEVDRPDNSSDFVGLVMTRAPGRGTSSSSGAIVTIWIGVRSKHAPL